MAPEAKPPSLDWRFWAIFPGLCLASFLCALDSTVISTALPTIVNHLGSASLYAWAINSYTLTFTAIQPLYGQAADVFGRRAALVAALLLFAAGSIACALAHSTATFIAGRALQGLGGGGLSVLPAMVVCDLSSLRRRQTYVGVVYAAFTVGTFVGPVIGGALTQHAGWRWIFWINLPLAGVSLALVVGFMRVRRAREGEGIATRLARVDYVGNALLVAWLVAVLYALSTGGAQRPWASWRVLTPLLLGLCVALPLYLWFETTSWCRTPTTPMRLFANGTSRLAFALTFLHGIILYWASYFLPVYFQAVRLATPEQSGVDILPSVLPMVPFGIVGGMIITRTGRYKPNQLFGYALVAIAFGCFGLLGPSTSTSVWVVLELVLAIGAGAILTALLPAIQAPLPESDVAVSTATWGLVQSLGFVCGVAIPVSIFNSRVDDLSNILDDPVVKGALSGGNAYTHSTRAYLINLQPQIRSQVISIFSTALKLLWQVELAFALLGFVLSLLIREVKLRETLDTEYGYKVRSGGDVNRFDNGPEQKVGIQTVKGVQESVAIRQ